MPTVLSAEGLASRGSAAGHVVEPQLPQRRSEPPASSLSHFAVFYSELRSVSLTVIGVSFESGIPPELVKGLSQRTGHELLGQSILFSLFKALGAALARSFAELAGGVPCAIAA